MEGWSYERVERLVYAVLCSYLPCLTSFWIAMATLCNACGINYKREVRLVGEIDLDELAKLTWPSRLSIHKSMKRVRRARLQSVRQRSCELPSMRSFGRISIPDILCTTDVVPSCNARTTPCLRNLLCDWMVDLHNRISQWCTYLHAYAFSTRPFPFL